jgi:hypothetical protein
VLIAKTMARPLPWLRSAPWDLALLGFGWVPFYAWIVGGLGLGGTIPSTEAARTLVVDRITLATAVVLGLTFVHRHYTFLYVYGERRERARRPRAFVVAPAVIFASVIASAVAARTASGAQLWVGLMALAGTWNVWHTIMQRYGIGRAYGRKLGADYADVRHARSELVTLWAAVAAVAAFVALERRGTFVGLGESRFVASVLQRLDATPVLTILAVAAACWLSISALRWLREELALATARCDRIPRASYLASTVALLGVLAVHGPVVGYLCFGFAHALEYLAFVHLQTGKRLQVASEPAGLGTRVLGTAGWPTPLLVVVLLAVYATAGIYAATTAYGCYYLATSLLHFLYDGWIWRSPREVALPAHSSHSLARHPA